MSDFAVGHLRVEHFSCGPVAVGGLMGLTEATPRLSWNLLGQAKGLRQVAYQLVCSSTADGGADLWDSGRVESSDCLLVPYGGAPLGSRQPVFWRVTVWNEAGDSATSELGAFEMGLLSMEDWTAEWIGSPLVGAPRVTSPSPYMRNAFVLASQPVRARLYVTALGLYEAEINGRLIHEDTLVPGWTDFRKRVAVQTYDVTPFLKEGENVLGAILGDGWYAGYVGMGTRQLYGDRPKLLAQLEVTLADGTVQTVRSGSEWRTSIGPILESDIMAGEAYDARREILGWSEPGFADVDWMRVKVFPDPGIARESGAGPRVSRTEILHPVADPEEKRVWHGRHRYIFDLGQNMVGRVRLRMKGVAGETLTIRHAEVLDEKGEIYTTNLRTARCTDYYTFRTTGEVEEYEPRFTFHGFRYVEVAGIRENPGKESLVGVVLGSATEPVGTFACSDPLVNQLQQNIVWGQRGNFLEAPTDCPQRDERLGWTGDAQVFIRTAAHNMDVAGFFTKWLKDLEDAQRENGAIPPVAPAEDVTGADGGPAWSDAFLMCPWTVYRCYGDTRILERHYDGFKKLLDYFETTSVGRIRCHPDYKGFHGFGDWLSIEAPTPHDLIGTAFYAHCAGLMSQMAGLLGKHEDEQHYGSLRREIVDRFVQRFVTPDGLIASQSQTAYVLALHFGLLPEALRPAAVRELVNDIGKRGWKLSTGFVGAPYLQFALTEGGRLDVAFRLLHQKQWPSWLYAVTHGATTIWERWDGWTHDKGFQDAGMNSFNHYAYGSVGEWLYRKVAGLDLDPVIPAYRHSRLHPHPGGGLSHAKATLKTPYGLLESGWEVVEGELRYAVVVPPNTTATVILPTPSGAEAHLDSGELERGEGISDVQRNGDQTTCHLASGAYAFRVRPWLQE